MSRSLRALCLALVCALPCAAAAQQARLSMSASSNRVQVGEPFAVEIRAEIQDGDDEEIELPDLSAFDVLGRRMSRPFSFSFGFGSGGQHARMRSEIIHTFTLRAREPGSFTIQPAIVNVGGRRFASRSLTIEVSGSAQPGGAPGTVTAPPGSRTGPDDVKPPDGPLEGAEYDPEMFLRTVVDKKRVYLGEQVTVTVYLYVRGNLRDNPTITREPTSEGFWVQDLLPPQRSLAPVRQEVNGRVFSAYVLRRFAAFPLRPGPLEIGASAVEIDAGGSLFDLFTGPPQVTRRNGVPVQVEVLELPARSDTSPPIHVGTLALEAALDPTSARIGDAVTLRVTARGSGNLRGLKLVDPKLPGIDVLPPEIDDKVSTDLDQVGGEREFRWLLLPRTPGSHSVPAFGVDVFDPRAGKFETQRSSPLSLEVTGTAAPGSASAGKPSDGEPSSEAAADGTTARPHFGPVRTESALRRAEPAVYQRAWYPWAVIAAPLCVLAWLAAGALARSRDRRRLADRGGRAFRAAQSALERASDATVHGDPQTALAAMAAALKGGLEARLGEPIGGLTLSALRQHLSGRGMGGPLTERLVAQLEAAELARFAPLPKTPGELEQALERTRGILRELEGFSPKGAT